uniref:TGF_BETA_2 domain-containing protein n=1 Tax=Rhabditophanes sp. KR3021 TaxID=114890 RepID=A0AC35U4T2_9BILA
MEFALSKILENLNLDQIPQVTEEGLLRKEKWLETSMFINKIEQKEVQIPHTTIIISECSLPLACFNLYSLLQDRTLEEVTLTVQIPSKFNNLQVSIYPLLKHFDIGTKIGERFITSNDYVKNDTFLSIKLDTRHLKFFSKEDKKRKLFIKYQGDTLLNSGLYDKELLYKSFIEIKTFKIDKRRQRRSSEKTCRDKRRDNTCCLDDIYISTTDMKLSFVLTPLEINIHGCGGTCELAENAQTNSKLAAKTSYPKNSCCFASAYEDIQVSYSIDDFKTIDNATIHELVAKTCMCY